MILRARVLAPIEGVRNERDGGDPSLTLRVTRKRLRATIEKLGVTKMFRTTKTLRVTEMLKLKDMLRSNVHH